MKHSIRSLAVSLAATVCLWPVAASAQPPVVPPTTSGMSVEQVRDSFNSAGFQADAPLTWDWTSPPVSSIQVHDRAHDRVLLALVYPDADAANLARRQAQAADSVQNSIGFGPHLVIGYGQSIWRGNVALVQTTESQLQRVVQIQNDRDNGVYVEPERIQGPELPDFAVDLDFQQALDNSAVNL